MQSKSLPPAIEISRITVEFRQGKGAELKALNEIDLKISAGEFVCVVGPSGCGKSTLLQVCSGLLRPTQGVVRANGSNVDAPGPDRGVVFQKDSVFPWMRVLKNVEYGLRARGVPALERRTKATAYLERVGLGDVGNAWPRELSGGMLKRVAIATVFANGSPVLLLDEPFGALDYVTRHKIQNLLLELWNEDPSNKRTIVFITHDVDEALTLADRIIVMRSGRIVDDIAVEADRPRSTETLSTRESVSIKKKLLTHLGLAE